MFYGSERFEPSELFLMLSDPPEDVAHDSERDLFALRWQGLTIQMMRLNDAQRDENLRAFGAAGGQALLDRLPIRDVLGVRWEGPDPKGIVDTVLITMCDVCGGYYLRDGRVLGARGPVPL